MKSDQSKPSTSIFSIFISQFRVILRAYQPQCLKFIIGKSPIVDTNSPSH